MPQTPMRFEGYPEKRDLRTLAEFLQCEVVLAVTSKSTAMLLKHLSPGIEVIPLDAMTNIQVLDSFADFVSLRRAQCAAFVREYNMLLIWSDRANSLLKFGQELEEKIVSLIWDEKYNREIGQVIEKSTECIIKEKQVLFNDDQGPERSVALITPIAAAVSILAISAFIGLDLHEIILQIKADSNYVACGIVLYFPLMIWLASFFAQTFSIVLLQLLGPVSHLVSNTRGYSGVAPVRRKDFELPHITIQCPVYKEDLDTVLAPALATVKEAIKTYELQGGTANLFLNDDGLQLLDRHDADCRQAFYKKYDIGFVARPPHGQEGYVRAGKFKKASNMNHALNLSYKLEEKLRDLHRTNPWNDTCEMMATESALSALLREENPPSLGGGDIRTGDLILLIDADTRIPSDCFLDAANEFNDSPSVAILQHTSLAFQVVDNYWENCMAYFASFVSEAMRFMTAGGDVCPFIGHNAFIRWSALQEIAVLDNDKRRWWSEVHVSEDFELSMRLQTEGYCIRMAAYSNGDFKEGVSLTVYDEFNRWQKYAFGISELIFNPMRYWLIRSPFTPLFREFIMSRSINATSKFTMISYMGSYYAIGSAWLLAFLNYFIIGWFQQNITNLYQSSFQILIATLLVYDVAVPVANAIYRYRSGQSGLLHAVYENMKWIMLLCVFFGGLSIHVTQSLVWHLLGIPLQWDSTAKSLESSYYFNELPMVWRKYKYLYALILLIAITMIVLNTRIIPPTWRIQPSVFNSLPIAWVLACHASAPLLLNPQSWLSEIHL
ncbi:Putative uncharacterized protein [Taphrina deformans PYCC 5710]|uniref:Uncharacterized protein n=1 Tax=Taphrina deformans (strain PYCC 5710 / ATCC 11124 / CBS 356.35 / IMI 108563 / JCM 9778 / NBRC 8474) TaxID=1097556 RepID=R4XEM8_TAPDE|nr:Putative uncharacterized protein [Taphrina deformans PYCC 5710]|eukprot:CCG81822.1 Putative uncharacterized protein [Taphrina deformans PYCC 5710]